MRFFSLRIAMAFAMIFAVGAGLASASAEGISFSKVVSSGDVVPACRTNDRLLATFKFVKAELNTSDKCKVYRFIARDDVQRACFSAIATAAGQAGYLQSLGISGNPSETPAFCKDGCNCADTISYRSIE